jgi:hypothetical protein
MGVLCTFLLPTSREFLPTKRGKAMSRDPLLDRVESKISYLRGLAATLDDPTLTGAADLIEELVGALYSDANAENPVSQPLSSESSQVRSSPQPESTLSGSTRLLWANRPR